MSKIAKWGNSLGLRVPKEVAAAAGLECGAKVIVRLLDSGALLVTPQAAKVIARLDPASIHTKVPTKW